ncbi:HET-domain-containing protein, partial [Melanomma pulvis-pyrius CBS 109.77]
MKDSALHHVGKLTAVPLSRTLYMRQRYSHCPPETSHDQDSRTSEMESPFEFGDEAFPGSFELLGEATPGSFEFGGEATSGSSPSSSTTSPDSYPRPIISQYPFPKPTVGRICARCRAIPVELFLVGSTFFSFFCKARHVEGHNCKGKHQIECHHCLQEIKSTYYHCGICKDDDLDICAACKSGGAHCWKQEHNLVKRIFDGKLISFSDNSTVTLDPKKDGQLIREVANDDDEYFHPGLTRALVEKGMEPYRLYDTLSELLASADAGCHSCSVLVSRIDDEIGDAPRDTPVFIETRPLIIPDEDRFTKSMVRAMLKEPDLDDGVDEGLPMTVLAVRTERDAENPVYENPLKDRAVAFLPFILEGHSRTFYSRHIEGINGRRRRQISPVVDAGDNLKVIGSWLQACLNGSSKCSTWPKEGFRPTRLIHVQSGLETLRLVRGSDIVEPFSGYASLSYCWGVAGKGSPWNLTRERLAEFEKMIPTEVLPKTIADAIQVVRANGIQYLWVDSLCIVQNDADDWTYEAYRMGQVYNGALAAELSLRSTSSATSRSAHLRLYPRLADSETMHRAGPTSKRAWCFQEELLSPRRLYFTEGRFNWECICSSHTETGTKGPGDVKSLGTYLSHYNAGVLFDNLRVAGDWCDIVGQYTSRQLTCYSDVFAALAGVAAMFKARYKSRYIAGLWEEDILHQLLWQRVGSSLARPTGFEAPSWSWLSVQGTVVFNRGDKTISTSDAEYLGSDVKTIAGNEFGTVAPGGSLRLRARL